jgi:hypothetical protein
MTYEYKKDETFDCYFELKMRSDVSFEENFTDYPQNLRIHLSKFPLFFEITP